MLIKTNIEGKVCIVAPYIGEFNRYLMFFPYEHRIYEHYRNIWSKPENQDIQIKIDFSSPGGRLHFTENGDPIVKIKGTDININLRSGFAIKCYAVYERAPQAFSIVV